MIRGIHHVAISTPDIDRLAAFYTDVVGFVPVTAVYAMTTGGILVWPLIRSRRIKTANAALVLMLVSLVMSVVMHRLFTEILVVDLP